MDLVSIWTTRGIRSKNFASIQMAWAICWEKVIVRLNSLGYPFPKKMSSVWTAWAVHLEKIVICSNGLGYPFQKIVIRSNGLGYPFEKVIVDRSRNWTYLLKGKF